MLTTLDNPFNPFTEFDDWPTFDEENEYFTCNLLDRLTFSSKDLSDEENQQLLNMQILDIVENDETSNYIRVLRSTKIRPKRNEK